MTAEELLVAMIDALEAVEIPYMVVGSFSSNYYGIARSTKDVDLVIEFAADVLSDISRRLGPRFRIDRQSPFETVTGTTRNLITVADVPFQVEVFRLSRDPHDNERFRRRQRARLHERETWLPTAEDVIIAKLRWAALARRNKDLDDLTNVIAVQRDAIDWDYVSTAGATSTAPAGCSMKSAARSR